MLKPSQIKTKNNHAWSGGSVMKCAYVHKDDWIPNATDRKEVYSFAKCTTNTFKTV